MSDMRPGAWWTRRYSVTSGEAALLGVVVGIVVAVVCSLTPPHDFSFGFLALLVLTLGPLSGLTGYQFWLAMADPLREQRLRRVSGFVALAMIVGVVLIFPSFWWAAFCRSPRTAAILLVVAFPVAVYLTTAGFAIAQLGAVVRRRIRTFTKPARNSPRGGVWDREIDLS